MSAHTPGPWTVDLDRFAITNSGQRSIFYQPVPDGPLTHIAYVSSVIERNRKTPYNTPDDVRDANAELIVRACNAHDDLVAALEQILWIDAFDENYTSENDSPYARVARAALAKAKGEA